MGNDPHAAHMKPAREQPLGSVSDATESNWRSPTDSFGQSKMRALRRKMARIDRMGEILCTTVLHRTSPVRINRRPNLRRLPLSPATAGRASQLLSKGMTTGQRPRLIRTPPPIDANPDCQRSTNNHITSKADLPDSSRHSSPEEVAAACPQQLVSYVLTRNEASNIRRSLTSLLEVSPQIVVVDSESTDETRSIAMSLGADVVIHPFEGFSAQRNWALDYIEDRYRPDYVLSLDADEWLSHDLSMAIRNRTAAGALGEHDVYLFHREIRFDGRVLRG